MKHIKRLLTFPFIFVLNNTELFVLFFLDRDISLLDKEICKKIHKFNEYK